MYTAHNRKKGHHTFVHVPPDSLFYQLFYLCRLADAVSQVIQFRASYFTAANHLDLLNVRRMQRPGLLNADSVRIFSYREGLSVASALSL